MAAVAVGMLLVASGVRFFLLSGQTTPQMLRYNTFTRLDGIAIGILTSLVLRGRVPSICAGVRVLLLFFGLGGMLVASELQTGPSPGAPPHLLAGMLGFPLVGIACASLFLSVLGLPVEQWSLVRWFRLVYLGKVSYGLYVYHYLALLLARNVMGSLRLLLGLPYALLGLALTIAFAIVSYHSLEVPFLKLKERFTYILSRPD